ncbi:type II toxin-antitoxin system VapC family toxin [Planotetraspora sp. GP83]|uniref:type II toxin-antitoxin system VapC family toxin n=1 Tax=Planotetraspora sp. GP83 TaxID=3156264 RepID=UPI0035140E6C
MIAVDTNILVYAHRRDSEFHVDAAERVRELAESRVPWAIPWACLHEFFSIVTHPRIYAPPSTTDQALHQIEAWLASPSLVTLGEGAGYWPALRSVLVEGKVAGPLVHDARIAGLCLSHGVRELWTMDRDFSRFPTLTTRNPLRRGGR